MSRQPYIVSKYAKRTVFANRGRSILTLLGIIVATVMFSIVVSAHTSARDILKSFVDDDYGTWHVSAYSISSLDYFKMAKDERVQEVAYVQEIGYDMKMDEAEDAPDSINLMDVGKYDYFIAAMSPNYPELCNLSLVRGRLPENENEVIISLEMYSDNRQSWQLGNTVQFSLYSRYSEGHKVKDLFTLTRNKFYAYDEQLYKVGEKEYTIVGYFVVPEYCTWKNIAKDTILTISDQITYGNAMNAYVKLYDAAEYQEYAGAYMQDINNCLYNKDYIRMQNSADDRKAQLGFTVLAFCAIFVILLLADMLIYNSFSTSSSERIRAIGLLKSVGATRRQVRELLFYEAFYYSIIGIPIGVVLGQLSSAILFHNLNQMATHAANYYLAKNINLSYRLCLENILIPIGYSILCIGMAITTPMIRMSKIAPIEALRANEVFSNQKGRKKSRGLAVKILGFTGALSLKNYIRHRKRYRATVISIVTSILMITSANMLVNSVVGQFDMESTGDNEITYIRPCGLDGFTQEDQSVYYQLASAKGVLSSRMLLEVSGTLSLDFLNGEVQGSGVYSEFGDISVRVIFLEDSAFRKLCEEHDLNADQYLQYGSELVITNNEYTWYDELTDTAEATNLFEGDKLSIPSDITLPMGNLAVRKEAKIHIVIEDVVHDTNLSSTDSGELQIYLPMSKLEYYGDRIPSVQGIEFFDFDVEDPHRAMKEMKGILEQNLYRTDYLTDVGVVARARDSVKHLISTVLYGYVILLSFMCFLNVVMTVISNIVFRRREYILLTSIGMSRKTLFRMVISESIIYSLESVMMLFLLLGIYLVGSIVLLGPNAFGLSNLLFMLAVIFGHLFVVVGTTAFGLSHVMKDEIVESVRKEYY